LRYTWNPESFPEPTFVYARYDFQPVPEPATVVSMGLGLALLAGLRVMVKPTPSRSRLGKTLIPLSRAREQAVVRDFCYGSRKKRS